MPVVQEDGNDQEKYMIPNTKSSLQGYLRVASLRDVHICMTPKLLPRILEYLKVENRLWHSKNVDHQKIIHHLST